MSCPFRRFQEFNSLTRKFAEKELFGEFNQCFSCSDWQKYEGVHFVGVCVK